ncbi:hypothetical protein [Desulfuromonas acetoxidans]|uniref:hypothetical protein n=1 Tax=Desulfuromonas acetoxidans TaxID=891 RepID=UPI00292DFB5F|nr:hypothetical protein [Desulfuromonas acetoxidans]
MTVESQIRASLVQRLATLTVTGGYSSDAGATVYINQEFTVGGKKPCLCVFFGDLSDSLEGETPPEIGRENHFMPVTIEGVIEDGPDGADAEQLKADISRCLKTDISFSGLAEGFEGPVRSSASVENAGEDGWVGFCKVEASIFYVTAYGES